MKSELLVTSICAYHLLPANFVVSVEVLLEFPIIGATNHLLPANFVFSVQILLVLGML